MKPDGLAATYDAWYNTGAAHWDQSPGKQVILNALRATCDTQAPLQALDIACGIGYLMEQIHTTVSAHWALSGIDFAPAAIERARQRNPQFAWDCADATRLTNYADQTFDILTCYGSWEHFDDPQSALVAAGRVLKPGGWLFAQLPTLGIYRTDTTDEGYYDDIAPGRPEDARQIQWNLRRETWTSMFAKAGVMLFEDTLARHCGAQKPGVFYFGVRIKT